jgi:ElaB/YqjD/DUF883 family membrane-anchored ribosome-binding protein
MTKNELQKIYALNGVDESKVQKVLGDDGQCFLVVINGKINRLKYPSVQYPSDFVKVAGVYTENETILDKIEEKFEVIKDKVEEKFEIVEDIVEEKFEVIKDKAEEQLENFKNLFSNKDKDDEVEVEPEDETISEVKETEEINEPETQTESIDDTKEV